MILEFKSDTKHRKEWFTGVSFSHPAKMALPLQLWIIENFTKPGETILDPMAGSGTVLVACSMGRNVIAVELESKFCELMKGNWEKIRQRGPMMGYQFGQAIILQGDARNLPQVLCDAVITSPPFADAEHNYKHGLKVLGPNFKGRKAWETKGQADIVISSPPYAESLDRDEHKVQDGRVRAMMDYSYTDKRHGKSEGQIASLPYGSIDAILTSPNEAMLGGLIAGEGSFFISCQAHSKMKSGYELHPRFGLGLASTPQDTLLIRNLQNTLGCGKIRIRQDKRPQCQDMIEFWVESIEDLMQKVIPFCTRVVPQSAKRLAFEKWSVLVKMIAQKQHLTEDGFRFIKDRIGTINNPQVDTILFSPPYEGSISDMREEITSLDASKSPDWHPGPYSQVNQPQHYGHNGNIGNLKANSYLAAMLTVYQNCYTVLKEGGLMVLVVKNFIRQKQVIRLDLDTIKLCEQAGFSLIDQYKRKLPGQSFWRTIYKRKYPDVETIDFEDVLVFRKQAG